MRTTLFLLSLICLTQFKVHAQTIQDTKDFIIEQVKANEPHVNYKTAIFFNDILKSDAERISNKALSQQEFENIFIYMRDVFWNSNHDNVMFTIANIIDIRDIVKVSTTRNTGKSNYYNVSVYIGNNFYAKEYVDMKDKPEAWNYLQKMEILIADNNDTAQKIKKAIILLGKLKGIAIKDGDLF